VNKHLILELKTAAEEREDESAPDGKIIQIPWTKPPSKRRREIIVPESTSPKNTRPIRADARARLVAAITQGRGWLKELTTGAVTDIEAIAARECCSVRKVNMTISLAFLARTS
jgi:site-specific DNA recombinase